MSIIIDPCTCSTHGYDVGCSTQLIVNCLINVRFIIAVVLQLTRQVWNVNCNDINLDMSGTISHPTIICMGRILIGSCKQTNHSH